MESVKPNYEDCPICCSEYYIGKDSIKWDCVHDCGFHCCLACFKANIKHSEKIDITCMNCKYVYTDEDLSKRCLTTFATKENKTRVSNLIIDSMEHLMPLLERKAQKYTESLQLDDDIKDMKQKIATMRREIVDIKYEIIIAERRSVELNSFDIYESMRCPIMNCDGFADVDNICDTCGKTICYDCNSEKTLGHICDSDALETVKYIRENSMKCPKCKTNIQRVSGCDQMYCVVCKTNFDYISGEKLFQKVENPHNPTTDGHLNDCRPVDIPTGHMLWTAHAHPLGRLIGYLVSIYRTSTTTISTMKEFLDEDNFRRLTHTYMAQCIANGNNRSALRGRITIMMNKREHFIRHLPYFETLQEVVCEILWKLYENLQSMNPVVNKQIVSQLFEIINWWMTIAIEFYKYKSNGEVMNYNTASLRKIIDAIPPEVIDGYITPFEITLT